MIAAVSSQMFSRLISPFWNPNPSDSC